MDSETCWDLNSCYWTLMRGNNGLRVFLVSMASAKRSWIISTSVPLLSWHRCCYDDHDYELCIQLSEIMRMWKSTFQHIDPITQLTGAAISSSVLRQHLSTKQNELLSEALSWMILPAIHHYWGTSRAGSCSRVTLPGPVKHTPASGAPLWAVALAVCSASVYQAEYGTITLFVRHLLLPETTRTPKLTSC